MKRFAISLASVALVAACSSSSSDGATGASSDALACSSASDVAAAARTYGAEALTLQRVASTCLVANIGASLDGGTMAANDDRPSTSDGGSPVGFDDAAIGSMAQCIRRTAENAVSGACATCYARFEACVVTTCADCPGDPMGKDCVACRCGKNAAQRDCVGQFETCGGTQLAIDCAGALR